MGGCPKCGAAMTYHPNSDTFMCQCGFVVPQLRLLHVDLTPPTPARAREDMAAFRESVEQELSGLAIGRREWDQRAAQRREELLAWMPPLERGVFSVRAQTPTGRWISCDFYDLTVESQDAYVAWIRSGRSFVLPDLRTER